MTMTILEQIEQRLTQASFFSADLESPEWERLYVKYNKYQGIVLSNIEAKEPGKGTLTRLVTSLQEAGYKVVVECPQPRLAAWCKRNGIKTV